MYLNQGLLVACRTSIDCEIDAILDDLPSLDKDNTVEVQVILFVVCSVKVAEVHGPNSTLCLFYSHTCERYYNLLYYKSRWYGQVIPIWH